MSDAAAWFALGGALGGALVTQVGNELSNGRARRAAHRAWVSDGQRQALGMVLTTANACLRSAASFARIMSVTPEPTPPTPEMVERYLDALGQFTSAIEAADLFASTDRLDDALDKVFEGRAEVAGWIARTSRGQVVDMSLDPVRAKDVDAALEQLRTATEAFRIEVQRELGFGKRAKKAEPVNPG